MLTKSFTSLVAAAVLSTAAGTALGQAKAPAAAPRPAAPATRPAMAAPAAAPATRPATAPALPAGFKAVDGPDGRFRLPYAPGWEPVAELPEGIGALVLSKPLTASVNVIVEPTGAPVPVKDVVAETTAALQKDTPGFKLVESAAATLGGRPAWRIVFDQTAEAGEAPGRTMQVFAPDGARCYVVTVTGPAATFDKVRADADRMLAAFQIAPADRPVAFDGGKSGVAFAYPMGWTRVAETPAPVVLFMAFPGNTENADDDIADSVTAMAMTIPADNDPNRLRNFAAGAINGFVKQNPEMKVTEDAPATVGGLPARRVTLAGTVEGRPVRVRQVSVVRGQQAYMFTCTADAKDFEKLQADLQRLLGTVQFRDAKD